MTVLRALADVTLVLAVLTKLLGDALAATLINAPPVVFNGFELQRAPIIEAGGELNRWVNALTTLFVAHVWIRPPLMLKVSGELPLGLDLLLIGNLVAAYAVVAGYCVDGIRTRFYFHSEVFD